MNIEIVQNVVLIGLGIVILMMYITAKAWDEIADEMESDRDNKSA